MHEMNELERQVADELVRDAGPVLPVDDRTIFETASTAGRPRWRPQPLLRATSYIAAGIIVALFGGFLLVGVVTQPTGDGAPAAGGTASPEGTPSDLPTQAPTEPEIKENDVIKFRTPAATALAIGLLASPAASASAQVDLEPVQFTGTMSLPQTVVEGNRRWLDGAVRGTDRVITAEMDASDPRLSGTYTNTHGYNDYQRLEVMIAVGDALIENDDGRWVGSGSFLGGSQVGSTSTFIFQGEDAYEGLTTYLVIDEAGEPPSFAGAVFAGEMPEATSD